MRNLSLEVPRGAIYGFLGPNGSGKTTTLRMICGLLTPDGGRGTCLGYDILTERDKIKRHVGYMTQRFSLYQDLTIQENLEFVAGVYGLPDPARRRARGHRRGSGSKAASGSSPARCPAAGSSASRSAPASCPSPMLLLLDEPTAGVDPKARREFWGEIHTLAADGMTVLVSTHYMDEAERCHEIAYIAYGELLGARARSPTCSRPRACAPTRSPAPTSPSSPRSSPACPASTWWRRSARACTSPAATRRRWTRRSAKFRADPELHWTLPPPSLEDVFIDLMSRSQDNFR